MEYDRGDSFTSDFESNGIPSIGPVLESDMHVLIIFFRKKLTLVVRENCVTRHDWGLLKSPP